MNAIHTVRRIAIHINDLLHRKTHDTGRLKRTHTSLTSDVILMLYAHVALTTSMLYAHVALTTSMLYAHVALTTSMLHAHVALTTSMLHAHVALTTSMLYAHVALTTSMLYANVASTTSSVQRLQQFTQWNVNVMILITIPNSLTIAIELFFVINFYLTDNNK